MGAQMLLIENNGQNRHLAMVLPGQHSRRVTPASEVTRVRPPAPLDRRTRQHDQHHPHRR